MSNLSMIVAMDEKRTIGLKNGLPAWKAPGDLKRFKALTSGNVVVMGRKTWDGLGKPLPGRVNVVLSRATTHFGFAGYDEVDDGPYWLGLQHIPRLGEEFDGREVFIIGGAQIYEQCLPLVNKLYITEVKGEFEGDTFFPEFDKSAWALIEREDLPTHSYLTYERKL